MKIFEIIFFLTLYTDQTLSKIHKDAVYIFYETFPLDQQILSLKTSIKIQKLITNQTNKMSFFNSMMVITRKFRKRLNFPKLKTYCIYSQLKLFICNETSTVL